MWRSAVQVCLGLRCKRLQFPTGGLAQLARAPALQAGGQRFESVILHFEVFLPRAIFDILKIKQVKVENELRTFFYECAIYAESISCLCIGYTVYGGWEVDKGVRWMPWLLQAMKDVISCDKPRSGANNP